MKTFDQLSDEDKKLALHYFQVEILTAIAEDKIRFKEESDGKNIQGRIDALREKFVTSEAPWQFVVKMIEDYDISFVSLMIARPHAKEAFYLEENENAVDLSTVRDMGQPPVYIHPVDCKHKH